MTNADLKTAIEHLHAALEILADKLTDRAGERVTDTVDLSEISSACDNTAYQLAELAALADRRGGCGRGDAGEEIATRAARHRRKQVRKVLGYVN